MIVVDAFVQWLQQNGAGITAGLALWIIFLVTIADHVERQNNLPRE